MIESTKFARRAVAPLAAATPAATGWFMTAPVAAPADPTPPADLTWAPEDPVPGATLDVSFTGCNEGEGVLVRVSTSSAGWYFDAHVTAVAPGVTNHASIVLDDPRMAPGQDLYAGVYCGGEWTDAEGRWVRVYGGTIGDGSEATTTTTLPDGSDETTTTLPDGSVEATTTTAAGPSDVAPVATAATPVSAAPSYTG